MANGLSLKQMAKSQYRRVVVHLVNLVQKNLLGDDIISVRLRMLTLRMISTQYGRNARVMGGCDIRGMRLKMGDGVFVNRNCYFDLAGEVMLGNNVGIGHGVTFITSVHEIGPPENRLGDSLHAQPITVKDGAWIGANATILPGITIESGAVVAACSTVTKDVRANELVAGVPAKLIRTLDINEA